MGVASLVIGLVSFFVSLIPLCGYVASIPAIVGLILGIVFLVQAKKREDSSNNGTAIAGIVLNVLALIVLVVYSVVFAVINGSKDTVKNLFEDAISDSTRVEHDSVANEIEKELKTDSSTTEVNPFDMDSSDDVVGQGDTVDSSSETPETAQDSGSETEQ